MTDINKKRKTCENGRTVDILSDFLQILDSTRNDIHTIKNSTHINNYEEQILNAINIVKEQFIKLETISSNLREVEKNSPFSMLFPRLGKYLMPLDALSLALTINNNTKSPKFPDIIPETITKLKLEEFQHFTNLPILPSFLSHLSLSPCFSQSLDNLLPNSLQSLSIWSNLVSSLPSNLKKLKISELCYPLPPIPSTLQKLDIILSKEYIPTNPFDSISQNTSITSLSIRGLWKDLKIDFLPPNVLYLVLFPWQPCLSISKPWPQFLKTLSISYNHPLSTLPSSLTQLSLRDFHYPLDNLPLSLQSLGLLNTDHPFEHHLNQLPSSLLSLRIGSSLSNNSLLSLPPSLTLLEMDSIDFDISHLTQLQTLYTSSISAVPSSLTSLYLHDNEASIPPLSSKITHLELSDFSTSPLPSPLPPSLEYLKCGYSKISELPKTLKYLSFWFEQYTKLPKLPENLSELCILSSNGNVELLSLPQSVHTVTFKFEDQLQIGKILLPYLHHFPHVSYSCENTSLHIKFSKYFPTEMEFEELGYPVDISDYV